MFSGVFVYNVFQNVRLDKDFFSYILYKICFFYISIFLYLIHNKSLRIIYQWHILKYIFCVLPLTRFIENMHLHLHIYPLQVWTAKYKQKFIKKLQFTNEYNLSLTSIQQNLKVNKLKFNLALLISSVFWFVVLKSKSGIQFINT